MQAALKLTVRVLAGKRVEFTSHELTEGEDIELIVLKSESVAASEAKPYISAVELLKSFPPSKLTLTDWHQIESDLQEEKDAWER